VNISTALKIEFMTSSLAFMKGAEAADKWDPPSLFADVRSHIIGLTTGLATTFGSAGKAW
jgi:fructose-bisphosphate aldolase class II